MRIGELPIGSKLLFGVFRDEDIRWMKVSEESDFLSMTRTGILQYDSSEYDSANRSRRRFGNNFFPHSNICQWLNARGTDWYRPAHSHDCPPSYRGCDGFLDSFTEDELNALVERDITVAVPLGSRKEFGKTCELKLRVCLPSASECGNMDEDFACEGAKLAGIGRFISETMDAITTRTGTGAGGHIIDYFRATPDKVQASQRHVIRPIIRLNPEVEVVSQSGDDGCFYMENEKLLSDFLDILQFN